MKDVKDLIIDALVDLYQNGPVSESYGICYHVHGYIESLHFCPSGPTADDADVLLEELFTRWPGFSGDTTYPVPGDEGQLPSAAFLRCLMWTGEYGARRWALAEFMLRNLVNGAA